MYSTNYKNAVKWLRNNLIMCNNITEIDPTVYDNARFSWEDGDGNPIEIFQWFLTDCSEGDVKYLEEHFPGLLFTYSELLDAYVLCVDHYGTAWDYVHQDTTLKTAATELGVTTH